MGLNDYEYARIRELMGREPTLTELGMFAVMWSEHCGYKYSRPILAYFKKYKEAIEGKGLENAGLVDIGDGLAVTMKVESHNHPSAVEPYQGAATGVGGILRDIFTMGARPIASLNSLRFGPIHGTDDTSRRNRYLFEHVVAGIAGYGNCVGVPTVGGEVNFHPRYSGNPLVNAMAVGIMDASKVTTAAAAGVGNPVIYLGSATGKDGIHGATFASDVLDEESESKRPNVQIGDPFAEKLLIEATLEALETGAIVAIQDMGAAGLTCSTIEMAAKGHVGMEIDLDLVPIRERDMSAYELMLSESQERMLCVAHAGHEQEVIAVFEKWGLHAKVIGHVTDEGVVRVRRHGHVEAEVHAEHLADECPTYTVKAEVPDYHRRALAFDPTNLPLVDLGEGLLKLLASPNIASKRWVFQQYDQQVQTQTALLPGQGDACVLAPRGTKKGLAFKIDGNARQVYFDPYVGGQLAVAEAARNVACTGAVPRAVTDGLNFGNPQLPHVYWQFKEAVRGIADACETMNTPVISGNVSFYNESDLGEVLPTPLIGMLGVLEQADRRIGMGLPADDAMIAVLSTPLSEFTQQGLGASEVLSVLHGIEDGCPVAPDMDAERRLCECLSALAHQGRIRCAHDLAEGGFAVALAEMAIVGGIGAEVEAPYRALGEPSRPDAVLFGEFPGRVIVALDDEDLMAVEQMATHHRLDFTPIGRTSSEHRVRIVLQGLPLLDIATEELREAYETAIPQALVLG